MSNSQQNPFHGNTHNISLAEYHIKDLKWFGDALTGAVKAAFPNKGRSRYEEVHVLLLSWDDDNLGVIQEVIELQEVLTRTFNYHTEEWKIPSKRSHNSLADRLSKFLKNYESEQNLLIIYYGGHGGMNDDRQCVWSSSGGLNASTVRWFGLQTMLEEAESDVLILLDCCAAASSAGGSGKGITEVIAACGFETWAPSVGEHSFTRSLIGELEYLGSGPPFSAALLHNKVLSRIKYWKPRFGQASTREKRKTPVYILLANEARRRSIELAPLPTHLATVDEPMVASESLSDSSSEALVGDQQLLVSSDSSLNVVWPDVENESPKVLISVSLEEDQSLQTDKWIDWVRSIPALVRFAHIEGVYQSDSSLIVLSVPVAVWDLLPENPAISFIGFVRSRNILTASSFPSPLEMKLDSVIQIDKPESTAFTSSLRSPEELLFMQVFAEEVGPWMDSLDCAKTFSHKIPFYSLNKPLLFNAVLACGGGHLSTVNPAWSLDRAMRYYVLAAAQLLRLLRDPNRDTELCALTAVILNAYEVMTKQQQSLQRMNHIAGARALIKVVGWSALSRGLGCACFWVNVGMEVLSCLEFNWSLSWDPDTWGVDMEFLNDDRAASEELWAQRMLFILAKIINFRATIRRVSAILEERVSEWEILESLCLSWNRKIPQTMIPLTVLSQSGSYTTSCFPQLWLIKPGANVGQLFFHTAMCLLAQIHPHVPKDSKPMFDKQLRHAHLICGLVAHVKDRTIATIALPSLAVAAEVLVDSDQQEEVLDILRNIQKETGWNVHMWIETLKTKWGRKKDEEDEGERPKSPPDTLSKSRARGLPDHTWIPRAYSQANKELNSQLMTKAT